ncbi:CHASE2 domain-containing protein [Muricauda sp. CAU 1633]|uniref:CHASE2 domain-containing protein n=1 Tax=Allomuricauda sp. CAU 1633 TaxID=2816036 RepID=UPI001A8C383E|nr:CHASE2 domain-containing protein [Muricauda sp. CAU 1633]MBO0323532.1 CHASE2 domain-containing protein [Muricauda sp. CAU 1633]
MLFSFIVLGLVTFIGVNLSFFTPFNNAFKDFSYLDLYYSEKLEENQGHINQKIVLVNIDRLNREDIALLLNKINQQHPKVIGLDVIFEKEKTPHGDKALAKSHKLQNLVTTYTITDIGTITTSNHIAQPNQLSGYSNFSFDFESSVVRNFLGQRKINDTVQTSFALAVAKKYLGNQWNKSRDNYFLKERPINYRGNRDDFLILENEDILGQDSIPWLKDKIVLLGYLGDLNRHEFDMEDKHFTPMNPKFVGRSAPDTFGLIIHANIISMILENDYISVLPQWALIIITLILTYLALAYFIWLSKRQLASYILRLNIIRLVFMVLLIWLALALFRQGILLKTAGVIATVVFSIGLIGYYKKVIHILHKKYKWNGYFFQE